MLKGKDAKRCNNCGHLLTKTNEGFNRKQVDHSLYCPCRKPQAGWLRHLCGHPLDSPVGAWTQRAVHGKF